MQVLLSSVKHLKKYSLWFLGLCIVFITVLSSAVTPPADKVTLKEDAETYTMDNGLIKVRISKVTGDLVSFRYKDMELFEADRPDNFIPQKTGDEPANNPNWRSPTITGSQHGYWSHDVMGVKGSAPSIPSVTIDPAKNGGAIAEISLKAISKGRKMGTGPGAPRDGNMAVDIEIRYTLERGATGIYTYCIFNHPAEYPAGQMVEARYCAKLAAFFDWMSIAKDVDQHFPKGLDEGDKYVYTTNQADNPAFGWSSTTKKVGLFFINPSMEYMSGGPTKMELTGHRNTDAVAAPCVLNYWRSSHYGGAEANVAEGEHWQKVVGPFFIYANAGETPKAIYDDARTQAEKEIAKWPFTWVNGVDYPKAKERAVVKGKLVLNDIKKMTAFKNLQVGLTPGEYVSPRPDAGPKVMTNWQRDAKFYQFWTRGKADGSFEIAKVRPGNYTLYAFTDGVLGEFMKAGVVVEKGKSLDLGKLEWTPVRNGKQLWEIGIPNRNASEFRGVDNRRDPAVSLKYATLFPDDVNYTIGKSDYSQDWYYQHIPHSIDPEAKPLPYRGVSGKARATPYTISFDLPSAPAGKAILRLAICGTGTPTAAIEMNGKPAGKLEGLRPDGVITRHGTQGIWYEKTVEIDASLMVKGINTLKIIVPEGSPNNGLVYDYIRLELADNTMAMGKN
jgi:rhamnogalacturonan endolyase